LIYPDLAKDTASGDLYLDDGETNNYLQKERTEVQFNWSSSKISRTSVITVKKTLTDDNQYPKASGKFINRAQIFNVKQEPNKVVNQWATNSNQQVEADAKYIFNQEESSLTLHDFYIPVDSGLTFNSTVTLFTIHWPLV